MDFLDEDARPRFVYQSKPIQQPSQANPQTNKEHLNKPLILITVSLASILFLLSVLFLEAEPFKSLIFWIAFSFFVGPFAPSRLTGGDIRVGRGTILEPPIDQEPEIVPEKQAPKKRSKPIKYEELAANPVTVAKIRNGLPSREKKSEALAISENGSVSNEWSEEDIEMLKKQMVKNPVGKPRRWEVIAEAFNGRHRVESVVKKAKELGERKSDDSDSYAKFLKNRKQLDTRVLGETDNVETRNAATTSPAAAGGSDDSEGWTAGEDIALLNALKAFPKDVTMRWEKIAAAVPGKSKAACMKRVADLKRDFRSSKTGSEN